MARRSAAVRRSTTSWRSSGSRHAWTPDRVRGARPERQADAGRAAAGSAEGRRAARRGWSRFPTTARRSARRSRGRCRASASTAPTSCSCSMWRTATSASRPASLARWRPDPRVRSLHGVEHRVRRGAGARSRMAHRHAEVPARPALTILLDIAPETAVKRKAVDRDRYERDLALQARVRESYHRQAAAADWIGSTASARRTPSRPTCSTQSGHDSRCRKGADLADPSRLQRPAHASSVAPVVLTSSTRTTIAPRSDSARLVTCERVADVPVALGGRQARLRRCRPHAPEGDAQLGSPSASTGRSPD